MQRRVLVVDDDPVTRRIISRTLEKEGYLLRELDSGVGVESVVAEFDPDLVLCDIMMPGRDGLAVCRALQADPATRAVRMVLISAKDFEGDKRAALDAGAVGYLVKPVAAADLVRTAGAILASSVTVTIRGCRGSIAAPEHAGGIYGGNTSCVDIALPGGRRIILDAGTGLRSLGNEIGSHSPARMAILITHFHWDHIQGLPFFKPIFVPGNQISVYGPSDSNDALVESIRGQMGGAFFPVSIEAFRSSVRFIAVQEEHLDILDVPVLAMHMFHPGTTLAYRLEIEGRSLVYAPDNEIVPETIVNGLTGEALRLARFAANADLLLHDCTYSNATYLERRGWGHSCPSALAAVAVAAKVRKVILFHHDPDGSDQAVADVHAEFQAAVAAGGAEIESEPARESAVLDI